MQPQVSTNVMSSKQLLSWTITACLRSHEFVQAVKMQSVTSFTWGHVHNSTIDGDSCEGFCWYHTHAHTYTPADSVDVCIQLINRKCWAIQLLLMWQCFSSRVMQHLLFTDLGYCYDPQTTIFTASCQPLSSPFLCPHNFLPRLIITLRRWWLLSPRSWASWLHSN